MPSVCSHCRYPLEGETPPGTPHPRCPECGLDPGDLVAWPPGVLRTCVPYLAGAFDRLRSLSLVVVSFPLWIVLMLVPRGGTIAAVLVGFCATGWLVVTGQQWSRTLRAMRDWTGASGWLGLDVEYRVLFHLPTCAYVLAMGSYLLYGVVRSPWDPVLAAGWLVGVGLFVAGVLVQRRVTVGAVRRMLTACPAADVRALAAGVRPSSVVLECCGVFMTLLVLPSVELQRVAYFVPELGPIGLLLWCGVTTDWRGVRTIGPRLSEALRRVPTLRDA